MDRSATNAVIAITTLTLLTACERTGSTGEPEAVQGLQSLPTIEFPPGPRGPLVPVHQAFTSLAFPWQAPAEPITQTAFERPLPTTSVGQVNGVSVPASRLLVALFEKRRGLGLRELATSRILERELRARGLKIDEDEVAEEIASRGAGELDPTAMRSLRERVKDTVGWRQLWLAHETLIWRPDPDSEVQRKPWDRVPAFQSKILGQYRFRIIGHDRMRSPHHAIAITHLASGEVMIVKVREALRAFLLRAELNELRGLQDRVLDQVAGGSPDAIIVPAPDTVLTHLQENTFR